MKGGTCAVDVLAAYVAAGGSASDATRLVGIRPSTMKRPLLTCVRGPD
jgi:hypothetical protein